MNIIVTAMENTENKLVTWLIEELAAKKRSQRWLARESGLSHSAVANIVSGYQPPTWGFCAAIAEPLGKHPVELFKMAGLLDEPQHGHDEPTLLHHYRQLSPGHQSAALAMLAGLAGQSAPVVEPAPAADIDAVCKLLARLDSDRLRQAAVFIRWLTEQPGEAGEAESSPVTWQDVTNYFASLSPEKLETLLTNLIQRFGHLVKNPDVFGDIHSEPGPESGPAPHQGTLF